jgi:hypothetical protein
MAEFGTEDNGGSVTVPQGRLGTPGGMSASSI